MLAGPDLIWLAGCTVPSWTIRGQCWGRNRVLVVAGRGGTAGTTRVVASSPARSLAGRLTATTGNRVEHLIVKNAWPLGTGHLEHPAELLIHENHLF